MKISTRSKNRFKVFFGTLFILTLFFTIRAKAQCTVDISPPSASICVGATTTLTVQTTPILTGACSVAELPVNLQQGLVGWYPFCGNANDASGNGANGFVTGATLAIDRFSSANRSYNFAVNTNQISVPTGFFPFGNQERSISVWFKMSSTSLGIYEIFNYGANISGGRFGLIINNGIAPSPSGIGVEIVNSTVTIPFTPDLNWHNLTVVFPNTTGLSTDIRVYLDGVEGPKQVYNPLFVNTTNCCGVIGKNSATTAYSFPGRIDDLMIYNRSLSSAEVTQIFNNQLYSVFWSTGETTPSITVAPTTTTTYFVTATNGVVACNDNAVVTVIPVVAPIANAGFDQTVCGSTVNLAANFPAPATGTWSLVSGSGTFSSTTTANTTVSNLALGQNVFRWTVSNPPCALATDDVTITRINNTNVANAGPNQNICVTNATLAANTPTSGIGRWYIVSGTGTFGAMNSATSTITGLSAGKNILRWTISDGICPATESDVTINVSAAQVNCALNTIGACSSVTTFSTSSSFQSSVSTQETILKGFWEDGRHISVFRASELNARGITAGNISGIKFIVTAKQSLQPYTDFTVKMGCTSLSSFTPTPLSAFPTGLTYMYSGTFSSVNGINSISFPSAFVWDGTSNILVEICFNNESWTQDDRVLIETTPYYSSVEANNDGQVGCNMVTESAQIVRPVYIFDWCATPPPIVSNAGINQTICASSTTLAANTPPAGTGLWSVVSGAGTFASPNSPTSTVSGLNIGNNILRWTISTGPCVSYTSTVTITRLTPATTANAGADQNVCATSATLAANTAIVGTGSWSLVSGTGTITIPSSPTSTVTGITSGTSSVFRWTIALTGCPSSTDDITITSVTPPTVSDAGPNQTLCVTSTTLAANSPVTGTGVWSVISGSATFASATDPFTGVSGLSVGNNILRWTIANAPCTASTDNVTITVLGITTANAGTDQNICATSATLAGNTPTSGTGTWSVVSGTATITSANSPTSTITGIPAGTNVVMRWTVSNPPCTAVSDDVTIQTKASPTVANAGSNQTICGTSTTLAANTAVVGTGTWTLVSGTGTITSINNPASTLTGLTVGNVVLRWTIANAPCTSSTDDVTITISGSSTANAGPDQNICATSATLAGNTPTSGTGTWSIVSGTATITSANSPTSTITGIPAGTNVVMRWTVSNPPCTVVSDDVTIQTKASPTIADAGPNQNICGTSTTLAANTAVVGTGTWTVVSGTGTITSINNPISTLTGLAIGNVVLRWTIANAPCTSSTDDVTITISGSSTANAGPDQSLCATSATLAGNVPAAGTGTWSVISGAATITSANNATSTITAIPSGTNVVMRWTVTNPPCAPASDDVTIRSIAPPTVSNAGADINICGTTVTLAGNAPAIGTGTWTRLSGTGTITGVNNPNATVSGITNNSVFRWTIANAPCTSSTDDVTVFKISPTVANAGPDQNVCATSATLAGNAPTVGTGSWSVVTGTATITNPALRNTTITALTPGTYTVLRWTIDNAPCASSSDDVTIRSAAQPTVSNAGADIDICGTTVTLAGNAPTVGTGTWTRISGTGTITGINNPNATVSGITGASSVFRWTIANAPCTSSTDDVTVRKITPTVSNAGPDQNVCATSATLAGNAPTVGTGSWSIVSGTATITNPALRTTTITALTPGTYTVLRWTIDNAPCAPSTDDVTIRSTATPTTADAGNNQIICSATTTLAANTAVIGTGTWSVVSGTATVTSLNNPASTVTGITAGTSVVLRWSIANAPCTTSIDDVTITRVNNPTTADAGNNQTVCAATTTLAGNTATVGTGTWSVVSGTATITSLNNPTSTVTGLVQGSSAVLRWTIANSPCASSTDDVTITRVNDPTTADAGSNQNICGSTATLAGNTATVGTGTWTLVSGTGIITGINSPNATVSGITGTSSVFRWTIANAPCTSSTDDVTINRITPTVADAGTNQNICGTTTTLAGNAAVVGTGTWSVVSGAATVSSLNNPTSTVTGLVAGTDAVLRWTITNAPCTPSTDDVTIRSTATPTIADAGSNQIICSATTTLAGNVATVGTGTWSVVSGTATVTSLNNPVSTVTGITAGASVVLRWSIANAPCTSSIDDVTITRVNNPTIANAGTDQTICLSSTTLAGNTPTAGTGTWSVVSGTATVTSLNNPTSTVTGLVQGSSAVLRWTIANAPCTSSSDDVTINYINSVTAADAGANQTICATSTTLAANTAAIGTGAWSVVSGIATVTNINSPTSTVTGIAQGSSIVLRWSITNAPCLASTDDVTIVSVAAPTVADAGTNQSICGTTTTLAGNTPTIGTGTWSVVSGAASITNANDPVSGVTGLSLGNNILRWTISNAPCTSTSDDVTISVFGSPTVADAGANQILCNTSTALAANTPTVGTGTWSVISGSATIADVNNPLSGISAIGVGNNILRWIIASPGCSSSSDDVTIQIDAEPTIADAGNNQTICGAITSLAGNTPTVGTGTWSVVSGTGTFANSNVSNTDVTGLSSGITILRWTIANGICASSQDDVTISSDLEPSIADAGANQTLCADTAMMAANTPTIGSGTWSVVSGTATIDDVTNPGTMIRNLVSGTTVLQWSIANGTCPASTDIVSITIDASPTVADAGADQTIGNITTTLAGNTPVIGTGTWAVLSGSATITNVNDPTTTVTGLSVGTTVLQWTITNGVCLPTVDDMTITVSPTLTTTICCVVNPSPCGTASGSGQVIVTGGSGDFSYVWNTTPVQTNATLTGVVGGIYEVTVTDNITSVTAIQSLTITDVGAPSVSLVSNDADNEICANASITFTANGADTYQFLIDGLNVGTAGPTNTLTLDSLTIDHIITVTGTTSGCSTTSAPISVNVIPLGIPDIQITATPSAAICPGTTVTFTSSVSFEGTSPTYLWKLNGTTVGLNNTYVSSSLNDGDLVKAVLISNYVCISGNANDTSNVITIDVIGGSMTLTPTIVLSPTCGNADGEVTVGVTGGSGSYSYSWNSAPVQTNATATGLAAGTYIVTVTDGLGCSNDASITLNNVGGPAITLTSDDADNTICTGAPVIFTAGGATTYEFFINGISQGAASVSNTLGPIVTLANGDIIHVQGNDGVCIGSSPAITFTVSTGAPINVFIEAVPSATICAGTPVSFTSVVTNGGATPSYKWQVNNVDVGFGTGFGSLNNGDLVQLVVTDPTGCALPSSSTSNVITMTIHPNITASVSITPTSTIGACKGNTISFVSSSTNAGANGQYAWYVNANLVSTLTNFASDALVDGDQVKVILTSSEQCVSNNPVTSNVVSVDMFEIATPAITLSKASSICAGDTITLSAPAGGIYLWSTGATTRSIVVNASGSYSVEYSNASGCKAKSENSIITVGDSLKIALTSPLYEGGYNVSKYLTADGSIDATITGGFTPYHFFWSSEQTSEDINNLNAGKYQLVVIDNIKCSDTAFITLTSPPALQLPRVFTPNGDGINDFFVIKGVEVFPGTELTIYNRWGNVVFESKDYKNEWQGQSSAGNAPDGTYFVVMNAKNVDGTTIVLDGYVELRRENK